MSIEIQNFEVLLSKLRLPVDSPSPSAIRHFHRTLEIARPFSGEWQFDWLLTDWDSKVWETSDGAKTRRAPDGSWLDCARVYWDIVLPDGHRLTDPKYSLLLESCKRMSALYRAGLGGILPGMATWKKLTQNLIRLSTWLVLHEDRYRPAEHGFKLFDQAGTTRLLLSLASGGWCEAHELVPRVVAAMHRDIFAKPAPKEYLDAARSLPKEFCDAARNWLDRVDGFAFEKRKKTGKVSRVFIANLISSNTWHLIGHAHLDVVLSQFESGYENGEVLLRKSARREFPLHTAPLVEEQLNKPFKRKNVGDVAEMLRVMLTLYRHLPDMLPIPSSLDLRDASNKAYRLTSKNSHTPFIPMDTGITYLNSALRWVVLYGDALVDYSVEVMTRINNQLQAMDLSSPDKRNTVHALYMDVAPSVALPQQLQDAGLLLETLAPPINTTNDFERFRSNPSLYEALGVYLGATTVLLGMVKPSRDVELARLPRFCLLRSRHGHYWLDSDLAKRTKAERRARTGGKPIPVIAARAIQQMRKLNRGLSRLFNERDAYKRSLLFYFPNPNKWGTAIKMDSSTLNRYLDLFCDFVGLPVDEHGRRWYVRIHEMRKWFLLLLFWSGRYDVLDAARWIAGHTDIQHLYNYIEREFPGGKIGVLEAECAVDMLARFDPACVSYDEGQVGLVELHQRVLDHFQVESLSLVNEAEWRLLIEELFEDEYHLEPYSMSTEEGDTRLCVAIRVGSRLEE